MIKKIFNKSLLNAKPSSSIISAAFVIILAGLASRFLGLIRDSFLASTFSAGDTLDTYYAAFRIPDLIYNLLILGALASAFIPVFTSLVSRDEEDEAWKMANGIINLSIFFIVLLSLIFAIFAPFLMKIITPGFSPEKMAKTVMLTRIMFLSPLFLGISGIFGGILTSFRRFLIYSIAPLFYNLGIIIGVLVFVRFLGPVGLAWGVVFGAAMHMMIQYPAAKNLGYRHQWKFISHFSNREVKRVIRLMIPRTLGIAVNQINLFVITIFASVLASGSLAIINLAQNLQGVPVGVIGSSFAIAVFPTLSAAYATKNYENFIEHFSQTFRRIMFFIIPSTIFILLLRAQLVRVILGHGKFDWDDTVLTFQALGIFSISLFAQCLIPLLARAFYSMHDTKTPFYIALVTEAVNIIAVIMLIGKFKILGLAMAFTLAAIVQMAILLFFLRLRLKNLDDRNILKSAAKIIFAAALAGIGVQLTKMLVDNYMNIDTFLGIFTQLAAAFLVGAAIFVLICQIIKIEEFLDFKKSITRKIFRNKTEITEDFSDVSGI
jgi:putative peptidoglycan lipid II flippase